MGLTGFYALRATSSQKSRPNGLYDKGTACVPVRLLGPSSVKFRFSEYGPAAHDRLNGAFRFLPGRQAD